MLDLQQISTRTAVVTDYKMINANLAKVVVATTGKLSMEDLEESITAQMRGQGAAVQHSFRPIQQGSVTASYVGFVKSVTEVREVSDTELRASYNAILASNANILVNAEDQSVWELKTGAGGKYLVRQAEEDLTNLVASVVNHEAVAPRLSAVNMPLPKQRELVAYVTPEGNLDYGFVTRVSSANGVAEVMSFETGNPRIVSASTMAGSYQIEIDPEVHKIAAANITREQKDKQIAYYRALFAYAPEYMEKVIQMVEGQGN